MSADALAAEMSARGYRCRVEAFDGLAVLIPCDGHPADPGAFGDAALRLAPLHGFTHVALELMEQEPAAEAGAPVHRG